MNVKINTKDIPFSILQILYKFEDELGEEAKCLLNTQFPNISIKLKMELNEWDGNPIRVKHNANILIKGSDDFISNINCYLSTRDDIGDILINKYSLVINIIIG